MIATLLLAAVLAEAADGNTNKVIVPLPDASMTCTKEGDHLLCVLPLAQEHAKEAAPSETQAAASAPSQPPPYKRSTPAPALPDPQVLTQLKVAERNIEVAKSLLPRATTPEEVVLAEQLLYYAKEQYRTTEAMLHTERDDLRHAPDPFERKNTNGNPSLVPVVCQADVSGECRASAHEGM
jgi:hypothetical protein